MLLIRHSAGPVENAADPTLAPLLRPMGELIAGGGDSRLTLSMPAGENSYGCTPFPQAGILDFASSTASAISQEALARAEIRRAVLLAKARDRGIDQAFAAFCEEARASLLDLLGLAHADVVFAPSGTDAQLHALFLARAKLQRPVTVIVAGADQTGSGTAYTCQGRHFSHATAAGLAVEKGAPIAGITGVKGVEISFCAPDGRFRDIAEMDEAVMRAAAKAVWQGRGVLLQAMAHSKFGWKAPSDACLNEIASRWPDRVLMVMDACQARLPRADLQRLLDKGFCVLLTGSKFFAGPAFSGALLVPRKARLETACAVPLAGYSSRHDWPGAWRVRGRLAMRPNISQALRWEAALEEMRLYYAMSLALRSRIKRDFRQALESAIARAPDLELLPVREEEATVFGVMLKHRGRPLPAGACAAIYHLLRQGADGGAVCRLGQPVALPARGTAALRISLSARLIRQCRSEDGEARLFSDLAQAVDRLDRLCARTQDMAA